jgi:dTDP-4-dehydrorhamnose 3,5-epimerase
MKQVSIERDADFDEFMASDGYLPGSQHDPQSVTAEGDSTQKLIAGVEMREIKAVVVDNGSLIEVWRNDWNVKPSPTVDQIFQRLLAPGAVSAWHVHRFATDRLFVSAGAAKVVLFDARKKSQTFGTLNVFRYGPARPGVLVVPPGVWHGVQSLAGETSLILNFPDRAYSYSNPDHWRLPADSPQIPYSFSANKH